MRFSRKAVFPFNVISEKIPTLTLQIGKTVTGVNCDVFAGFSGEQVKFMRQQCLWLDQEEIGYTHS